LGVFFNTVYIVAEASTSLTELWSQDDGS